MAALPKRTHDPRSPDLLCRAIVLERVFSSVYFLFEQHFEEIKTDHSGVLSLIYLLLSNMEHDKRKSARGLGVHQEDFMKMLAKL